MCDEKHHTTHHKLHKQQFHRVQFAVERLQCQLLLPLELHSELYY